MFYDASCPLCRREIALIRSLPNADAIEWNDVSSDRTSVPTSHTRSQLLERFHVRLANGRLVSGARAFAEMWSALPRLRWLGRVARHPLMLPMFEGAYRVFLRVRPALQRLAASRSDVGRSGYPRWLERELRSDHAGETGAVAIYRGLLAVCRDPQVRAFAKRHLVTEQRHLALMETLLARSHRSALLPLWRIAGFVTGALPGLLGARAVYVTIEAVETFVDHHYGQQIDALRASTGWPSLVDALETCRADEVDHRDEAAMLAGSRTRIAAGWQALVGGGSAAAISAVELATGVDHGLVITTLAVLGGIIGSVSFSGSLIAFGKLQGLIKGSFRFRGQNLVNGAMLAVIALLGVLIVSGSAGGFTVFLLFALALTLGVTMTLPIGGADMPVVISLYNALTGLAVGFEGHLVGPLPNLARWRKTVDQTATGP